jgi:lyso-ornithine lipid O-acyltransferase
LQGWATRVLRAVGVQVEVSGEPPTQGLLLSNHLSYLDILVYSSIVPVAFVSKAEVSDWPMIGRFARFCGTIFIRRQQRGNSLGANAQISKYLHAGVPVLLFPEGTTTAGKEVLRFHASMLQPAVDAAADVCPSALGYELPQGNPEFEVCWWGDMTLAPHVLNLLKKKEIRAKVSFGFPMPAFGHRKEVADQLRHSVLKLRAASILPPSRPPVLQP